MTKPLTRLLAGLALALTATAAAGETTETDATVTEVQLKPAPKAAPRPEADPEWRELYIKVTFNARQEWLSETEEYGKQHSTATTEQTYELRTRLRSNGIAYKRNILHLDREKRLEAKTIHLAREAVEKIRDQGGNVVLPTTPEAKQRLSRQLKKEEAECGADMSCRMGVQMHYAQLMAAAEYPQALKEPPGGGQFLYFEPYEGCPVETRVTMEMNTEGVHWHEGEDKLVPFKEARSADVRNAKGEVPLCERYLAVLDTGDDTDPMYLENFFLPSVKGETAVTELGRTQTKTENQPQPHSVLSWVTQQLRHAPASGSVEDTIRIVGPLNGISRQMGDYTESTASVKLTWHFKKVEPEETGNGE